MNAHRDRFDGLAETYERFRPGFPDAIFAALIERAPAEGPKLAVDVGAGVGLSSEGLLRAAPADWRVVAVEPGADMRGRLQARLGGEPRARISSAAAEALDVEDGAASAVLAARALHWFDRPRFFAEARRILAPRGLMASLFNRPEPTPATAALEAFFDAEGSAEHAWISRGFDTFEMLGEAEGFTAPERVEVSWSLEVESEALIGLFLSRSTLRPVIERLGLEAATARMAAILAETAPGAASHRLDYAAVLAICRKEG